MQGGHIWCGKRFITKHISEKQADKVVDTGDVGPFNSVATPTIKQGNPASVVSEERQNMRQMQTM